MKTHFTDHSPIRNFEIAKDVKHLFNPKLQEICERYDRGVKLPSPEEIEKKRKIKLN